MTTLLKNAWVYAPGGVIQGGFVAVDGPVITYVGAARPEGVFDCEKDMSGRLLLPGLVNAHTHAAMTLLRGVGTDLPLQRWLFDSVFPVEGRMTAADIRAGTALALLEMLACGTTSSVSYTHLRSGSAMVMTTPRTKASTRMSHRRRDLVIFAPTRLPIWVMDSSCLLYTSRCV